MVRVLVNSVVRANGSGKIYASSIPDSCLNIYEIFCRSIILILYILINIYNLFTCLS